MTGTDPWMIAFFVLYGLAALFVGRAIHRESYSEGLSVCWASVWPLFVVIDLMIGESSKSRK